MKSRKRKSYRRLDAGARRAVAKPKWTELSDEVLLDVKICDLGLQVERTPLEKRVAKLYRELEARGLRFRPHCWLSDEWFCPDGNSGIAIPFYLAHPRLIRLERAQMLEVEGGTEEWCMRILRHEAGHAIGNAYRLHRRRHWSQVFGKYSQPYPECYQPRPYSKSFVLHLDPCYAQAHPAEDFAETFAVWLKPRSSWRTQYSGWPALKKLEYIDELMTQISGKKPATVSRVRIEPVRKIRKTLREHYSEKRNRYAIGHPSAHDRELLKLFSEPRGKTKRPAASAFLRRHRAELRRVVAAWTGQYQYTVDQVLKESIDRCRELNLRLDRSEPEAKRDAFIMLTVQTMNYLHGGHHRYAL